MNSKAFPFLSAVLVLLAAAQASPSRPQTPAPAPPPRGEEPERAEQEPVRIYTQEVKLPVVAYDEHEHFDPTLEADDVLVVEDGVPQRVRSARRIPANVLLVFDMSGQVTVARSSNLARDAALRLLATLRPGDRVAVIQNGAAAVSVLQDWTTDGAAAASVLKTKLLAGRRSRLSECLALAAGKLGEHAEGSTHVVVFTDGLESQSREQVQAAAIDRGAVRRLAASQSSVHIFCFATLVKDFVKHRNKVVSSGGDAVGVIIDTDFEMRRWYRNYARAIEQRREQLTALAAETGGRVLLPASAGEVVEMADKLWRDIGAQYVVTYTPAPPLEPGGRRRRVEVFGRRVGLRLFSLRSSIGAASE